MDERQRSAERRVDAFVAAVNASGRERMASQEVPVACRASPLDEDGMCEWRIVPGSAGEWLPALETRLPFQLPPTFRALVSRYWFPSFTCGPLWLYSVGLADDSGELRVAMLRDRPMLGVLWKAGFLPFARPEDGSYDPVCFDFRDVPGGREPAVVRVDHEEALIREQVRVVRTLSASFDVLVEELTG